MRACWRNSPARCRRCPRPWWAWYDGDGDTVQGHCLWTLLYRTDAQRKDKVRCGRLPLACWFAQASGFQEVDGSIALRQTRLSRDSRLQSTIRSPLSRQDCGQWRKAMINAQLPEPKFKQVQANNYKVSVTLENDREARQAFADVIAQTISEEVYESLTKEERNIIRYLSANRTITVKIASKETERSDPTADKILLRLVEKDIIEPTRKGNTIITRPKTYNLKGV